MSKCYKVLICKNWLKIKFSILNRLIVIQICSLSLATFWAIEKNHANSYKYGPYSHYRKESAG